MAVHMTRGVLFVHSAPARCAPTSSGPSGRVLDTRGPGMDRSAGRAQFAPSSTGRAAGHRRALASALRGWEHLRYEVTEEPSGTDGGRWMHTPDLGIFRQTDVHGNIVIPEDRIRYAMEIRRRRPLRRPPRAPLALGQAWDDELEPFRHASEGAPVRWLHQVGYGLTGRADPGDHR